MELEVGKSVCKIVVHEVCQGTGFVLFDDLIITNAHLFAQVRQTDSVQVSAIFDYEPMKDNCELLCEKLIYKDEELDYAIIKLSRVGKRSNPNNQMQIPGLLKRFGPVPVNGEAFIIGYPRGEVKQIDCAFLIKMEERINVVDEHLERCKDKDELLSVMQQLTIQHLWKVLYTKPQEVVTYKTRNMYHGSSGSPVFDYAGHVFGLHTGGFLYKLLEDGEHHVMEFAYPLLFILEKFVNNLREKNDATLLKRIFEEAKGNEYLEKMLTI